MTAAGNRNKDVSLPAHSASDSADIAAVVGMNAFSFCYFFFGRAKKK